MFTATPLATSRPPSAMSSDDTSIASLSNGVDVVKNNPVSNSKLALAKSNRVNGTPLSVTKGSMGPPALKSRPSTSGTQMTTPSGARGLSRSSSTSAFATPRPGVTSPTPTAGHRRGISANSERESITPSGRPKVSRSRSVITSPTNAGMIRSGVAEVREEDEKENVDLTEKVSVSTRRRNLVAALS